MKIPLDFDREDMRLSVISSIIFKNRPAIPVLFVIDTGSPVTFVDEFQSSKVRIYAKNLAFDHDALMGGTKIRMYCGGYVKMGFLDEKDALVNMNCNMMVAETAWTRKEATYTASSIIGLDFFLNNKVKLYADLDKNEAYMER